MTDDNPADAASAAGDERDALPADLQPEAFVGDYEFPDNSRRRVQGSIYLAFGVGAGLVFALDAANPIVNVGWGWVAAALIGFGVYAIWAGQRMNVDEKQALVATQQAFSFPVGYASAQQVWRGWRSRPVWRVLAYSTEDPPTRRGLAVVDAVDGTVVEYLVEPADPAEWES